MSVVSYGGGYRSWSVMIRSTFGRRCIAALERRRALQLRGVSMTHSARGDGMSDTLADMIRQRGVDHAEAPAITYADRTITYGELDSRSNQVAHALHAAGI